MAIKSILVPAADTGENFAAVLEAALVVARRFDSHITVLHVSESTLQGAVSADLSSELKKNVKAEEKRILSDLADSIRAAVEAFARRRRLVISDRPVEDGAVNISFHQAFGKVKETLVHWARLFDTTAVIRSKKPGGILARNLGGGILETVMLQSGRPVLMVPPKWEVYKAKHAVIAWNHSLEASRALAMTLPWLTQMKKVTVVVSRTKLAGGERVVQHLDWYGVKAEIEVLNRRTSSVGKRLLKICDNVEADFLVMGGYSHSRMQERVFGGVTDHVMRNSKIISVMVH